MRRLPVLGPLLAVVLAIAVPAAPAKTVGFHNIKSPTGKITCYVEIFKPHGIECNADYVPKPHPYYGTDPYLGLHKHGKAELAERGDFAGHVEKFHTVAYGDTWKPKKGITCHMKESGLTCRNKSHHGFHMAQGDVRRF